MSPAPGPCGHRAVSGSLYQACESLFAVYPLAVNHGPGGSGPDTIVLILSNGWEPAFFVVQLDRQPAPVYSVYRLHQDPAAARAVIGPAAGQAEVPGELVNAVTAGVPLPRNESLFGWKQGTDITALVSVHADLGDPKAGEPVYQVMPLAGLPHTAWPPFTGEPLFGAWFWGYHRAGDLMSVASLIAAAPAAVFCLQDAEDWCCAVARDVPGRRGTLLRGCYVYYRRLETQRTPPLDRLLASPRKVDLAEWGRRMAGQERRQA